MALQQSGIEYIAKNAGKFISDAKKVNRVYESQARSAKKASDAVTQAGNGYDATAGKAKKFAGENAKVNTGLGSLAGKLPSLTKLIGGAGLAGALLAGGQAAIQFGQQSLDSFQKFETAAAEVFTLLPNLSEQGIGAMTDDIQAFALESGRTTDVAIPALYQALSAGVPQDNVFDFLETALAASKGGVTDLETSVDTLTSVLNAYNLEADSAGRVSDALFTAVRLGKTTFGELGKSIFNVTPTAAALGIEIETVSAALAALTAAGVPTSVATTQLRSLFDELAKSGSKAAVAFETVSGTSFDKFIKNGGTVEEALQLLKSRADELDTPLKNLFSSTEAGSAALLLATTGADKFSAALVEMESAAGATEAAAAQFSDTLQEAENRANAASEALRNQLGESLSSSKRLWLELKAAVSGAATDYLKMIGAVEANSQAILKSKEAAKAAGDELRNYGENGRIAAGIVAQKVRTLSNEFDRLESANIKADANVIALKLLEDGFAGTAQEAANLAVQMAIADQKTEGLTARNVQSAEAGKTAATALRDQSSAANESASSLENQAQATAKAEEQQRKHQIALKAAQEFEKERQGIAELTAKALRAENITREEAVSILEKQYGNQSRATNILDQELTALENANGGLDAYIARNKAAAEATALLDKEIDDLRDSLSKISSEAFQTAESIIGGLVELEDQEDIEKQIVKLQENRRKLVTDLISESSDLTFDQEIDLQLAFGEISLEQAELLRIEEEFFATVKSLFGPESVINLGDRAVSIGSLIVQNSGPEAAALITDQVEALVTSGLGSSVDAAIDIVPQLVASGTIGEDAVGDFVSSLLGSIDGGASVQQAIELAISATVPNEDEARAAIESLRESAQNLSDGEYAIGVETNSSEAKGEIDEVKAAADDLNSTDPDVEISTNGSAAKGEIDAVKEAINSIKTEVVVNIRANRTGDFGGVDGPAGLTEFMRGGWTGGKEGKPAGIVHGEEVVIPAGTLRQGPGAALAFMMSNVPFYQTPATQGFSSISNVSNVTTNNIDNSRSLQTGNIGEPRQFNRIRHDLLGDQL